MDNKKEFLDIFKDGMNDRFYGEFRPSTFACGIYGCKKLLRDEKEYLRHRRYDHKIK